MSAGGRQVTELAIQGRPYGARELKQAAQRYAAWALGIAAALHLAAIGAYWLAEALRAEEPPTHTVRITKYSELPPPPSISGSEAAAAVSVNVATAIARPSVGLPVPVPDEEASPEQTIATQEEMAPVAPVGEGEGGGDVYVEPDLQVENIVEEAAPPPDFVPVEKEPMVVNRVEPVYPPAAQQAGLEGTVVAKLWVDKEGKVKQVVILKSPDPVFNQAVVDAALQWTFTPAIMNNGPVAVWISYPFRFRFRG